MLHEERKRVKVFSGYLNLEATAGGVLWEKGLGFIKKETPAWVFCELWQISSLLFYKTDLDDCFCEFENPTKRKRA